MPESVETGFGMMPVIKIVVMEKRTADKCMLVDVNVKKEGKGITGFCDVHAMLIGGNVSVLTKAFEHRNTGMFCNFLNQRGEALFIFFVQWLPRLLGKRTWCCGGSSGVFD